MLCLNVETKLFSHYRSQTVLNCSLLQSNQFIFTKNQSKEKFQNLEQLLLLIYNNNSQMSLRLRINKKLDPKLQQEFPEDPYADITIHLEKTQIRLSLAYLAIQSQTFSDLPPDTSAYNLSNFQQDSVLGVLRALYGGQFECSSANELNLIYPIIKHLGIDHFRQNIEEDIKQWLSGKEGGSGVLEWIDVCLRHDIQREWVVQWLISQHLKILESTKNYLQLGKMSDYSINLILLEFLKKKPELSPVANTIMENYFNRKGHSPNIYFQSPQLAPLKNVWDQHHFRFKSAKIQKISSFPHILTNSMIPTSSSYEPKTAPLSNKSQANYLSMNITPSFQKKDQVEESNILDMKLASLQNDLFQKQKQIKILRDELEQLEILKGKRELEGQQTNEEGMVDIALLKSRMRSKKQKNMNQESASQYALDTPRKRVIQAEKQQKLKVVSKGLSSKKE